MNTKTIPKAPPKREDEATYKSIVSMAIVLREEGHLLDDDNRNNLLGSIGALCESLMF